MRTSHNLALARDSRAHWRRRPDALESASERFLRAQSVGARRSWSRCVEAGVLTDRDLAQGDLLAGTVPVSRGGSDGRLECLPWSVPGLVLARVMTETGCFTLMVSMHRDGYHAFAGVDGDAIQGVFPTFAAAWEFALGEGLVEMGRDT